MLHVVVNPVAGRGRARATWPKVRAGLEAAGARVEAAQLTKEPQTLTGLEAGDAAKVVRMVDALEELDDVQNVYTTADPAAVDDEVYAGGAS